jgi:hypothetical protein
MKPNLSWARNACLAVALLASASHALTQAPASQAPVTTVGKDGVITTTTPVQQPIPPAPQPIVPAGPPGKLEVLITEHDFGSMIEGEIARHTFEMKSTGDNPLVISSAKPTCGCTVSHIKVEGEPGQFIDYVYGQPVATGKRLQLEAQLDTKNKHNLASSRINISCNDPRQVVTLGLSAMVDTYFAASPPTLDFGDLTTSDVRELSAVVSAKRGGKFKLRQDVLQNQPGFKVEINPQNPDDNGTAERWEVKVTMGPDCREGSSGYPIQLRSDQLVANATVGVDGQAPAYGVQILVQARVRGLISFEPQYVSFGLVSPGMQLTRTIKVSTFDDKFMLTQPKSLKLAGPSDALPEFRWAENFELVAKPSADGKTMDVDVTLKGLPEGTDASFHGRVMIETGHPSRPTIAVILSGV